MWTKASSPPPPPAYLRFRPSHVGFVALISVYAASFLCPSFFSLVPRPPAKQVQSSWPRLPHLGCVLVQIWSRSLLLLFPFPFFSVLSFSPELPNLHLLQFGTSRKKFFPAPSRSLVYMLEHAPSIIANHVPGTLRLDPLSLSLLSSIRFPLSKSGPTMSVCV